MTDFDTALMGLTILAGLVAVVFWGWRVVHCCKNRELGRAERLLWLLVVVFGKFVGAGAYYLFRCRGQTLTPARAA